MSTIGIIGYGYVGTAVGYGFRGWDEERGRRPKHELRVFDKFKKSDPLERVLEESDHIFVCLPTPFDERALRIDLTILDRAMEQICPRVANQGKIVVLKSTVVPGTTRRYNEMYPGVPFAFNPEFLTEANYLRDFVNAERIVIGADNDWTAQSLIDLYRSCFSSTPILKLSATAAEIVKYQCNITLATRVAVANVFYDLCQAQGVNYEDVRKAVSMDSRIGESHLSVTSERGFGGKCFPKDLGAIIGRCRELGVDARPLEEVFHYNLRIRRVRDWEEIAGASVGGRRYRNENDSGS
jgi:UDPglucose 6-dehydrogenase